MSRESSMEYLRRRIKTLKRLAVKDIPGSWTRKETMRELEVYQDAIEALEAEEKSLAIMERDTPIELDAAGIKRTKRKTKCLKCGEAVTVLSRYCRHCGVKIHWTGLDKLYDKDSNNIPD